MSENRACKVFDPKDPTYGKTNCASCRVFNGTTCKDELYVMEIHEPATIIHTGWYNHG